MATKAPPVDTHTLILHKLKTKEDLIFKCECVIVFEELMIWKSGEEEKDDEGASGS